MKIKNFCNMAHHKIMLFGRPGSGKSTFACKLHALAGIPLYHLDKYFYRENWVERNYQEFLTIQENIVTQPSWIIDGNNTKSLAMRYSNADLIIYFNYPRSICYWRVFKRFFTRSFRKLFSSVPIIDDRAPGCIETIRLSLLRYMWSFETRVAEHIKSIREHYPDTCFMEIKNDAQCAALEAQLRLSLS